MNTQDFYLRYSVKTILIALNIIKSATINLINFKNEGNFMCYDLINSYEIETTYGRKSIEIHEGDLTDFCKPFDILVLSAVSYHYLPTEGTLVKALIDKNIDIYKLSKDPYIDLRKKLHIWISNELDSVELKFKRFVCVEFDKRGDPNKSFEAILPFLSLIEKLNIPIKSIAMPLLGTGYLNLSIESNLELQLKQCEKCLENIPSLSKIYLVEKNKLKAHKLDIALNKYLDRSETQTRDIFLDDYNKDVLEKLEDNIYKLIKFKKSNNLNVNYEILHDFYNQIKRKSLRYFELCSYSRKLVEVLLAEQLPWDDSDKRLQSSIDSYLRQGNVSPWITSYMHVIRVLSNNQIHYSRYNNKIPSEVQNQDQRILLGCLYQITDYWLQITYSNAIKY